MTKEKTAEDGQPEPEAEKPMEKIKKTKPEETASQALDTSALLKKKEKSGTIPFKKKTGVIMQSDSNLRETLRSIDHKSYPAYKSLRGSYRFADYVLSIDHVQGRSFLRHLPMCA